MPLTGKYLKYSPEITLEIFTMVWNKLLNNGWRCHEKEIDNVKWNTIHGTINYLCDPITPTIGGEYKIIATIPTKNGWHIITKPFNRKQFSDKYPEIDIQTNNPTICYMECL